MKIKRLSILFMIAVVVFAPLAPLSLQAQDGETVHLPSIWNSAPDPTPIVDSSTTERVEGGEPESMLFLPNVQGRTDESTRNNVPNPITQPPIKEQATSSQPQPAPPVAGSGMPARPLPAKPIPHHEAGRPSKVLDYKTAVTEVTAAGVEETVTLAGLDAMLADDVISDPLAGNYTLVNLDKVLMSSYAGNNLDLQTVGVSFPKDKQPVLEPVSDSNLSLGNYPAHDIAAGDLNGDGQDEQIAVWISDTNQIWMSIGEMPGSLGRTTSAPAAVTHADGTVDLLVRGYDEALWHRHYENGGWGEWNNEAGGLLLSAPAVAARGDGTFDVFVINAENRIQLAHWGGSNWDSEDGHVWQEFDQTGDWPLLDPWFGPTPDLPAPAAVARGTDQLDLFRLGSDNTLRWRHFDGADWDSWQNLGGMLASAPSVVSTGPNHMQVFARGVDEALWALKYDGDWQTQADGSYKWQRIEMPEGITIASAPTTVASVGGIDVYVQGSDHQLWQLSSDNGWNSRSGDLASSVAVVDASTIIAQKNDGSLQRWTSNAVWEDWNGLPPCCMGNFNTGLTIYDENRYGAENWSLDVETGHLKGDGRNQVIVAYYSEKDEVTIATFDISGGFIPRFLDKSVLKSDIQWFNITTGDFLAGNGIEEIAVAQVAGTSYGLDILGPTAEDGLVELVEGYQYSDDTRCWGGDNYMKFAGTLDVASGNFDADLQDEVAMMVVLYCEDYETSELSQCRTFRYHARTRILDIVEDPDSESYKLMAYSLEEDYRAEAERNAHPWSVSLALVTGDVDGDGRDDIVRSWPAGFGTDYNECIGKYFPNNEQFSRKVQILSLPADWSVDNGKITNSKFTPIDDTYVPSDDSDRDRLAIGDIDRDLKGEIVGHAQGKMRIYGYDNSTYSNLAELAIPSTDYAHIVTGDFTREGIHVGPPSYRVQNRVDTLMAVVNMPPKHRDLVKDAEGEYQLIESPEGDCNPSPDSPDCTHAKHGTLDLQTSEQTVQTLHAYEISAGTEAEACAGAGIEGVASVKACVRTSLNASHGGNFEKSTDSLQSVGFRRKVVAASDDKIVYFGTPYGVWEYPILAPGMLDNPTEPDADVPYITVAFPLASITQYPDTSGGYISGACDERWFSADHQPNNVWSYDPIGDVTFPDYNPAYLVYDVTEGDWAEGEITFEKLESAFKSVEFKHAISARVETEVTAEAKIKIVDLSANFKAHVQGDYSNSQLKTDRLTTDTNTAFSYFLAPQPDNAKFTTRVLFYRANDDYQVLNFQAEPGRSASWRLYDKPDPAFILPWYGFPNPEEPVVPPCGEAQKLFSPAIVISHDYAEVGDSVTISATVRNFSNETARDVTVRLCHGDPGPECNPGGTAHIGERSIALLRRSDGSKTVSATWTAGGAGRQKIYAVIDPDDTILEVHDGDDLIDNNVAYASIQIGAAADADMGHAVEQPYDSAVFDMDELGHVVAFYSPRASLSAVTRFELRDAQTTVPNDGSAQIMPFELVAYQGSKFKLWNEPIADFSLRTDESKPPAVIVLAYTNSDLNGVDEAKLNLYRLNGNRWVSALCAGYDAHRFPDENLIAVPVCQTGIFALSDRPLPPLVTEDIYLPTILRSSSQPGPQQPDLIPLQLTVEPSIGLDTGTDVVLSVVLQNIGDAPAGENFWVDLFVNPKRPPAAAGDIWTALCPAPPDAPYECDDDLGLAWQVTKPVAPGEVITLTSVAGVDPYLHAGQTQWFGHFNRSGTQALWVYVDVWNGPGAPSGWVEEVDENNNVLGPETVNVDGRAVNSAQTDVTHRLIPRRPLPDQ